MNWYNLIAPVYDNAIRTLYLPYRRKAVEALCLQPGATVLDLGCGSGLNFELILEKIGVDGTLIGVDFSQKMLDRARKLVVEQEWKNVYLLECDARDLDRQNLITLTGRDGRVDNILCTLGLSVFPAWQEVFAKSYRLLETTGRYCVMDLFNENSTFQTRLINFLASSDISRRVWEPLEMCCEDYVDERHKLMHGSEVVIVASGRKSAIL